MTTLTRVQQQYEVLPYPHRDPERELEQLLQTILCELPRIQSIAWGGPRDLSTLRVLDAAGSLAPDEPIPDARAEPPEHLERARVEGRAAEASRADRLHLCVAAPKTLATDGRVGRDDPIDADRHAKVGDGVDVFVGEVWRDLHEERHAALGHASIERLAHSDQERLQALGRLEVAKSGGVR